MWNLGFPPMLTLISWAPCMFAFSKLPLYGGTVFYRDYQLFPGHIYYVCFLSYMLCGWEDSHGCGSWLRHEVDLDLDYKACKPVSSNREWRKKRKVSSVKEKVPFILHSSEFCHSYQSFHLATQIISNFLLRWYSSY